VASANPEDYTNRGRIITPLKDRFGSQIRTHYPLEVHTEVEIMRQEAVSLSIPSGDGQVEVEVPDYLADVVATFSHLARASSHVNQRSGVSVRLSVANYEALAANALRRGLRAGERHVVPGSTTSTRWRQFDAARSRSSHSRRAARARSSRT
jgi:magnesium chelatase subunit I